MIENHIQYIVIILDMFDDIGNGTRPYTMNVHIFIGTIQILCLVQSQIQRS